MYLKRSILIPSVWLLSVFFTLLLAGTDLTLAQGPTG